MLRKKEIMTAVATLGIAAGIGFAVQSGEAARDRYGAESRPVLASADVSGPRETRNGILLEVDTIALTSTGSLTVPTPPASDSGVKRVSALASHVLPRPDFDTLPRAIVRVEDCVMTAVAKAMPGAIVDVTMSAPCAVNERLTVHHHGLMFTMTTDESGTLHMRVPALRKQAVFIMAFANGDGAVAHTQVMDLVDYDRVAVQWRGPAGVQLHAREFGADYGKPGHVWSGSDTSAHHAHGVLTPLGNAEVAEARLAEIFTFPTGRSKRSGRINMSVEAEVTARNCGREIEAQTIQMSRANSLEKRDLFLTLPDCDAVGSFLVLNNLVSDLKVASN